MKSKKGMMRQTRFAPYLKELEKKYEGNKQKYQEEMQKLYKEETSAPPAAACGLLSSFPFSLRCTGLYVSL
jgi:YidC/Oxa1 family membrane protein insertase